MAKFAIGIEYDGSHFHGWQRQKQSPTVQAVLESAISRVADDPLLQLHTAGRTDAGVHALGQVAHFETFAEREERQWVLGINSNLEPECAVLWLKSVPDDFHARFSALSRSYQYVICNRWVRPVHGRFHQTWVRQPLDAERMHTAAQALLGEHDFSSFRAAGCQAKHARREIQSINVQRTGDQVVIDVTANAFLYHMVRNIAGTLIRIGSGDRTIDWLSHVLAAKDRRVAGMTAPPQGLYFVSVKYPAHFDTLPTASDAYPYTN